MDKTTKSKIDNLCKRGYQNVEDFHVYEPEINKVEKTIIEIIAF